MEISPKDLRDLRVFLGLTIAGAAASVRVAPRTWESYEADLSLPSYRPIPAGRLELFCRKNKWPYPPTRRDGTMSDQTSFVITLLSGTGGCGKTSIALEVGRVLASAGKSVKVVTAASGVTPARFCFDNPEIYAEGEVRLTRCEVKDLRANLMGQGAVHADGSPLLSGVDLFIAAGDLKRLATKSDSQHSLDDFRQTTDVIILDDAFSNDLALAVSDLIIFIFDFEHWAAYKAAEAAFRNFLDKNKEAIGLPQLRALLVNVSSDPEEDRGIHTQLSKFGLPILHTVLSNSHRHERQKVGHAFGNNVQFQLLVDAAPDSLSTFQYRSLAAEIERELSHMKRT